MIIFPKKIVYLSNHSHKRNSSSKFHFKGSLGGLIWVSKYPIKETYDVSSSPEKKYGLTDFVSIGYPGCGFFVRTTNSHTYMRRVLEAKKIFRGHYFSLLTSSLPSFSDLIARGKNAAVTAEDVMYRNLFEFYLENIILSQEENRVRRVIAALRLRMKGGNRSRYSEEWTDYKRSLRQIEQQRKRFQFDFSQYYSSEIMEEYARVVDAFSTVAHVHHIWDVHLIQNMSERQRVFFDLGALDFVCHPVPIPLMRNSQGHCFFILPDRMVRFRGPYDLDTFMLRDIDIRYGALGDGTQSEVTLSPLNLSFRFGSVHRVEHFVTVWRQLQDKIKMV